MQVTTSPSSPSASVSLPSSFHPDWQPDPDSNPCAWICYHIRWRGRQDVVSDVPRPPDELELGLVLLLSQPISRSIWPWTCHNGIFLDNIKSTRQIASMWTILSFFEFRLSHPRNWKLIFFNIYRRQSFSRASERHPHWPSPSCHALQSYHQYLAIVIQIIISCTFHIQSTPVEGY